MNTDRNSELTSLPTEMIPMFFDGILYRFSIVEIVALKYDPPDANTKDKAPYSTTRTFLFANLNSREVEK